MILLRCRCGQVQPLLALTVRTSGRNARTFAVQSSHATRTPQLRPPQGVTVTKILRSQSRRNTASPSLAKSLNVAPTVDETPAIEQFADKDTHSAKSLAEFSETNIRAPNLAVEAPPAQIIDTEVGIADLVDSLVVTELAESFDTVNCRPVLYVNVLGIRHFRPHPKSSILLIHASGGNKTYLIDIKRLGKAAFHTPGKTGKMLNDILHSKSWLKYLFMAHNICGVLFAQFHIEIYGVRDLQRLGMYTRKKERIEPSHPSFDSSVDSLRMDPQEKIAWEKIRTEKEEIRKNYKMCIERPITPRLTRFYAQIPRYYSALRSHYEEKLSEQDLRNVWSATDRKLNKMYGNKKLAGELDGSKGSGPENQSSTVRKVQTEVYAFRKIKGVKEH